MLVLAYPAVAGATPVGKSDFPGRNPAKVRGVKWPNSAAEGTRPIITYAEPLVQPSGFSELLPYIIAAPDQQDAGSCLYMSLTGIAEWWLARLNPSASRAHDGPLDLSERFMMNLGNDYAMQEGVAEWRTDSIYLYNNAGHGILNSAYRFTEGWYTLDTDGDPALATATTHGAEYGTEYNWIDQRDTIQGGQVKLPHFEREVIYSNEKDDQWAVAVLPNDIVGTVKAKLLERRAPVHVMYNHFGVWHSVNIVGFDDQMDSKQCEFVTEFDQFMPQQAAEYRADAAKESDAQKKANLLALAAKQEATGRAFHAAYTAGGGCLGRGMFFVRDSIYEDKQAPYVYDAAGGADGRGYYTPTVVKHEYEWLRYMANHVTQVYVK
jgi:hypothetical protein